MTATSKGRKAALGFRCHSGWAAAIVVRKSSDGVQVVERRRIDICDPAIPNSKQPYHAAEPMPFSEAEAFIAQCRASSRQLAVAAVETLLAGGSQQGLHVASCGVLWGSGRPLPTLREILNSHSLIHAAEGEFYREVMSIACKSADVRVVRVRERDAMRQASDQTSLPEAAIRHRLSAIGRTLGPPWTADQKLATLAGWLALR